MYESTMVAEIIKKSAKSNRVQLKDMLIELELNKIGMTQRLDPQERINELSGASVPFKFDVHAMIFSDDAPALEAALHRAFEDKKVNVVNQRQDISIQNGASMKCQTHIKYR